MGAFQVSVPPPSSCVTSVSSFTSPGHFFSCIVGIQGCTGLPVRASRAVSPPTADSDLALCWRGAHTHTELQHRRSSQNGERMRCNTGPKEDFLEKVASELKLKMASSTSRPPGLGDSRDQRLGEQAVLVLLGLDVEPGSVCGQGWGGYQRFE